METQVLRSELDRSINYVLPMGENEYLESRFVSRSEDAMIVYLSSMTGCDLACRMCHLTQTGQTAMRPANVRNYFDQAHKVFEGQDRQVLDKIKTVHYNFMARGDLLSNPNFTADSSSILGVLDRLAKMKIDGVDVKFKLSTIFPNHGDVAFDTDKTSAEIGRVILLTNRYLGLDIELYYSLYSLFPSFRRRWLPKSLDPEIVGETFRGTDIGLRLHHALIAGENDSPEDIDRIHDWLERYDLNVMFNLVRYNSYGDRTGRESSDETRALYMNAMAQSPRVSMVQEIPKVGEDVKASCGTFVEGL